MWASSLLVIIRLHCEDIRASELIRHISKFANRNEAMALSLSFEACGFYHETFIGRVQKTGQFWSNFL